MHNTKSFVVYAMINIYLKHICENYENNNSLIKINHESYDNFKMTYMFF